MYILAAYTKVENLMVGQPNYDVYIQHGKEVLVTAVLCILTTAPVGMILINYLGT